MIIQSLNGLQMPTPQIFELFHIPKIRHIEMINKALAVNDAIRSQK